MDNTMNVDHLGVEDVQNIASIGKNVAASITDRAKRKAAQKVSDAGQYWTLRPYLKSLIPIPQYVLDQLAGQGVTKDMVINLPAQQRQLTGPEAIEKLKGTPSVGAGGVIGITSASGEPSVAAPAQDYKKYLPYVFGVLLLGGILYAVTHQAK